MYLINCILGIEQLFWTEVQARYTVAQIHNERSIYYVRKTFNQNSDNSMMNESAALSNIFVMLLKLIFKL